MTMSRSVSWTVCRCLSKVSASSSVFGGSAAGSSSNSRAPPGMGRPARVTRGGEAAPAGARAPEAFLAPELITLTRRSGRRSGRPAAVLGPGAPALRRRPPPGTSAGLVHLLARRQSDPRLRWHQHAAVVIGFDLPRSLLVLLAKTCSACCTFISSFSDRCTANNWPHAPAPLPMTSPWVLTTVPLDARGCSQSRKAAS